MNRLTSCWKLVFVLAFFLLSACGSDSSSGTGTDTTGDGNTGSVADRVSNALTMSGNDTAVTGTRFPVTGDGSKVGTGATPLTTVTLNADACAIQPASVCEFLGVLTLIFEADGTFNSASLFWGIEATKQSFNYYLSCFPLACGSSAGITYDAAARTLTFSQVEFKPGFSAYVSAGGNQTAPLILDGTVTLSNAVLP